MSWNIKTPGDYINGPLTVAGSATITGDLTVRTNKLLVTSTGVGVGMTPITPLCGVIGTTGAVFFRTTDPAAPVASPYIQAPVSTGFSSISPVYGFWYQGSGIGSPALNNVSIITDSAERYKIDATGISTWSVSGTTAMTLNSTGLGVGVVPAAGKFEALETGTGSGLGGIFASTVTAGGNPGYVFRTASTNRWAINLVGTAGSESLRFYDVNAATTRMTLDASGNLLVGFTSNPNTARAYFRYDTLTTQPVINSASVVAASTSWSHFIGQSGNGSSITTSNIFIYGNGNIQNVNGVYGTISDLRLKENISDARNYLTDLLKLRVVKYSLKEEASSVANKLGFIAQEVEQVFPAMVDTDPNDGNKGIKTSVLIPMLVKAIQELSAEVNALKNA
jgi:hypothetical protein